MLAFLLETVGEAHQADFMRLYEQYKRLVWTTTGRFFGEKDRRWEAYQNTWLRVALHFEKIILLSCEILPGYLVTIVKNECRSMLAADKRYARLREESEEWERFPSDTEADPEALFEQREAEERVTGLMQRLPEPYRTVLEMRLIAERTNKETAKALGITEAKASTWFSRGKEKLERMLKKEGICDG